MPAGFAGTNKLRSLRFPSVPRVKQTAKNQIPAPVCHEVTKPRSFMKRLMPGCISSAWQVDRNGEGLMEKCTNN